MNAQNAHEYLPLVQALADGKTLQQQNIDGEWLDISSDYDVYFYLPVETYRIKPEPRTFEVWVCITGYEDWQAGDLRCDDNPPTEYRKYWERITVMEVLK